MSTAGPSPTADYSYTRYVDGIAQRDESLHDPRPGHVRGTGSSGSG